MVADTTLNLPHPYPVGGAADWIATHADNWERRVGVAGRAHQASYRSRVAVRCNSRVLIVDGGALTEPLYGMASKKKTGASEATLPTLSFPAPRAFSKWLADHHASSRGIWLKIAKKASGATSITYAEAIDVALAWGWIDGQKRSGDDAWWLQKFTPRGTRSVWSKINREKAQALIEAGAMQPAGLAAVERAKRDGRWDGAYDPASRATVPDDLQAALAKNPRAAAFFATLDARNRYAVLWRVQTAKKAETRERRIADFVAMLARGEKLHP